MQESNHFFETNVQVLGLDQQRIGALRQSPEFFAAGERRRSFGNVCSGAVAFDDDSGSLQFEIGAGDGVGIDDELLSQNANGRKFLAGRQSPGSNELFDLIDDLNVDRNAVAGYDVNLHDNLKVYQSINTQIDSCQILF